MDNLRVTLDNIKRRLYLQNQIKIKRKEMTKQQYEEIYILDYTKRRKTSRQTVYSAIQRGELDSVSRFGNKTFILMNDKGEKWRPQRKFVPIEFREKK